MYDRLAPYYDWEHERFLDDLPLYTALARSRNGAVLDLACGTGRVLMALAADGHPVTGLDNSPGMLEIARKRIDAAKLGRRASVELADMRHFDLRSRFDLAVVPLGSFHHLVSGTDQRSAISSIAEHLTTGGLLALDLVNPAPEWLLAADGTLVHQLTAPFPDADGPEVVTKLVARTLSFETQSERQLIIYDRLSPDGPVSRVLAEMELRYLFRYEAEMLISAAGFRQRDLYGDYDLSPYGDTSPRMIFVAEKL